MSRANVLTSGLIFVKAPTKTSHPLFDYYQSLSHYIPVNICVGLIKHNLNHSKLDVLVQLHLAIL